MRNFEDFGSLLDAEPGEKTQFHHLRFSLIEPGERVQRVIQGNQLAGAASSAIRDLIEIQAGSASSSFRGDAPPSFVEQNMPHNLRGDGVEMCAMLPIDIADVDQFQVSLMDEVGRLDGLARTLVLYEIAGNPAELVINAWRKTFERATVTGGPSPEELRGFGGVHSGIITMLKIFCGACQFSILFCAPGATEERDMKAILMMFLAVSAAVAQDVTVCIQHFDPTAPGTTIVLAEKIAGEAYAAIGVQVRWLGLGKQCPAGAIHVEMQFRTPRDKAPGALAIALPYQGTTIQVFWDRIVSYQGKSYAGRILAHVLMHEIGHILEGIAGHSETGVMKAHWNRADNQMMVLKTLPFAAEDVELIQDGAHRRLARVAGQTAAEIPLVE